MSNSAAGNGCISPKTSEGSLKIGKIPRVKIKVYNTWRMPTFVGGSFGLIFAVGRNGGSLVVSLSR